MSPSGNNAPLPPEHAPGEILAWSELQLPLTPAGRPALALWRPQGIAIAIGVSQSSETDITPEAIRADGAALVRRASGGGSVVLCEGVLCWEVWADLEDVKRLAEETEHSENTGENGSGIRAAYAVLSRPTVQGLRALGVEAFQAGICDIAASAKDAAGTNGANAAPRKLAGTAQLRRRGKALVHGSLLVHADLSLLQRYLPQPTQAPDYRAARNHADFCANAAALSSAATMPAVAKAIAGAATALGWDVIAPPEQLPPEAEKLAREKYLSTDWNWKKIRDWSTP